MNEPVNKRGIVFGRHSEEKRELARRMRRDMTPAEKLLWARLRANRLGNFHFRRQQNIDGFIADFYCHAVALVVELDGGVHESQADYDRERDEIIARRGLRILRFPNERLAEDIEGVLKEILDTARRLR